MQKVGSRTLVTLAALIIVIAGFRAASELLLPIFLAVFLAVLSAPPVLWLERRWRWPASLAVIVVVFCVMLMLAGLGSLVAASVRDFSEAVPVYRLRIAEQVAVLSDWLGRIGIDGISVEQIYGQLEIGTIMTIVGDMLNGLLGALTNTALVLLTTIFMLIEASGLPRKMLLAFGHQSHAIDQAQQVMGKINRYLLIKTAVSLATGILVGLWAAILGVDFAILWGLIAFLLNFIPNIGSVLAAIPAVLIAFIQLGLGSALLLAAGYIAINMVIGNMIEPQVLGSQLGLSPLVVFLSLLFWGWVWGPVGMLLSVPLTMVLKILLEQSEDSRWIAVLLGDAPIAPTKVQPPPIKPETSS